MSLSQRVKIIAITASIVVAFTIAATTFWSEPTRAKDLRQNKEEQLTTADDSRERWLGRKVSDFELLDAVSGDPWRLSLQGKQANAVVLYFIGTECPVTNRYLPALKEIQARFAEQNVMVVAVNSNAQDTVDEIRTHAQEYELTLPVLSDAEGKLARSLSTTRTAEAIVLDAKIKVRYRGVIDDRFERGVTRPQATETFLIDALDAVLKRRHVKTAITEVEACPINFAKEPSAPKHRAAITYSEHAAPIIQNRCQSCHRPNGIGPFELMTYDDAQAWSTSIREVLTSGLMPPWHADAPHGHFANDRSLTDKEYQTMLDWIDDGALEGDKSKLPPPRSFSGEWTIGKPDLVVKMEKEITVPAETPKPGVPYKYIWAGEPFEEETWVRAAEVHPGAPEVVHHVIAYIVPEGVEIELENDERPGDMISDLTSP